MSYSRQTWPPSLGKVPVPLVTLAIAARGAPATGCRSPPAVAEAPELPDGRQAAPADGSSDCGCKGVCAKAARPILISRYLNGCCIAGPHCTGGMMLAFR